MGKFLLCFCLLFSALSAEIVEIKRMAELKDYLKPNTLLILDIDNTLIVPMQTLGSDEWFYHQIEEYKQSGMNPQEALEEALEDWESVQYLTKVKIVEPGTVELIASLQKEGWKTIGLTTRGLAIATRTVRQLASVGINLAITAPFNPELCFLNPHAILFRQGILFTAGTNKGEALLQLLKTSSHTYSQILFVNDKASHLKQVEASCNLAKIPFIGLRYGYLDERVKNFNPQIGDIEFHAFGHLLSDEEAMEKCKMQSAKCKTEK